MTDFKVGDKVLVIKGLFQGCTGVIAESTDLFPRIFPEPDITSLWIGVSITHPDYASRLARTLMKENLVPHSDIAEALYLD